MTAPKRPTSQSRDLGISYAAEQKGLGSWDPEMGRWSGWALHGLTGVLIRRDHREAERREKGRCCAVALRMEAQRRAKGCGRPVEKTSGRTLPGALRGNESSSGGQ